MTNFDFLLSDKQFDSFSYIAISAEKMLLHDCASSVINCLRAVENATHWIYSVDSSLELPYQKDLSSFLSTESFREIVGNDIITRINYIKKIANHATKHPTTIKKDEAELCLENLFIYLDFISFCYSDNHTANIFDKSLLNTKHNAPLENITKQVSFDKLIIENEQLKQSYTNKRLNNIKLYAPKPLNISEYKTRKIYIDTILREIGWIENKNWKNEVKLDGMPNASNEGYADYVLYSDDNKPLAVIEAKRTSVSVEKGRQQAKLYADILEKQYGIRPVVFLTNGFETRINDNQYPERIVSAIYSKRDLEKLYNLRRTKKTLTDIEIDENIAGRYYQIRAIKAVCNTFDEKNRRKALLVMATGSGKTRTIIALCDVLLKHGWIKNILFLADRTSLVNQAKKNFNAHLPNLSTTNLTEAKPDYHARCILSTYQTMINCIDNIKDDDGKIFSVGHFDIIICDEAHRSIYNKYKEIFTYFDAPLVGLTATPKDEVDKNTYDLFGLENKMPTDGYELAQAVKDGYLVDFKTIETKMKFLEEGIVYDELSEDEKEEFEQTFINDGVIPEQINATALNSWLFNENTIKQALSILMTNAIHIDYGNKIGKTIIFAKNHEHAERIFEIFGKEYPHLKNQAKVIDNYINYADSLITEFEKPNSETRIAISVDMLDTGIDIPDVLNLMFFKKVMSKSKFWQMIGRGTRLCEGLLDGEDKKEFYIFDFCSNFEFFRINKGGESTTNITIQCALHNIKTDIVYQLQNIQYQTDELTSYRKQLVSELVERVTELNRDNFVTRQYLKYIDCYQTENDYMSLTLGDVENIKDYISPLILSHDNDANALRFDILVYNIELAILANKNCKRYKQDLIKRVHNLTKIANIPEIDAQKDIINNIVNTDYLDNANIGQLEEIRLKLRDLFKYVKKDSNKYDTNFTDNVISIEWRQSELDDGYLKNYKAKAELYLKQHENNGVIQKLKTNQALNNNDINELEHILWSEIGTREEYETEYQNKPLGEFVREIVGLDINTAKQAFATYLNDNNLDIKQIHFLNLIIEYIVQNGLMKDFAVLQELPFSDIGNVAEIFKNNINIWNGIKSVINDINAKAA